ncbi:MAG: hypothetical protein ABTQ29_07320 [Siculibacillus sp.]
MAAQESTSKKTGLENDYPAQIYSGTYHPPEYVAYLDKAVAAVRSLKMVVFGILIGSLVMAFYGFVLIYQLTRDSHRMVEQIVRMTEEMVAMRTSIVTIGDNVDAMRGAIVDMGADIRVMNQSVGSMTGSVQHLASSVGLIQHSTANLDRSFGPAMGMLNNFVPFGWGGNSYRGAPPYSGPPPR